MREVRPAEAPLDLFSLRGQLVRQTNRFR